MALKRMLRGSDSSPQEVTRFRIEALAASQLAHPHIVPVFQVGEHEGQPFFTMQYIEGTTLAKRLADGPLPGPDAARLLVPVCRAVQFAHGHGVLHRDLKPSNVLIGRDGHPYVSDFGLAKRFDPGQKPRSRRLVHYLAPQATCLRNRRGDRYTADLWRRHAMSTASGPSSTTC